MLRTLLSPRLAGLHVLAILATGAMVMLGLWQYDAWQARRDTAASDLASAPERRLQDVMSPDDPFPGDAVGQPVTFTGEWVPGSTVYVAYRDLGTRSGYWAVTPVAVCPGATDSDTSSSATSAEASTCAASATSPAMLVVRGWTASPRTAPQPPSGPVAVDGWLQPPEGSGQPDPDPSDNVLSALRTADAIQFIDQDLYGAYVISDAPASEGLTPVDPTALPEPGAFTALRNLLYALEWWVFAAFVVFVWWRWCADEARRRVVEAAHPSQEPVPRPDSDGGVAGQPAEVASRP